MKISFIGTGGAFASLNPGNSNLLLEAPSGKLMCIDFGTTAPYILRDQMKVDLGRIDAVYITHCHADHIGGLEFLSFYRYFVPTSNGLTERPKLFVHNDLIRPLWERSLQGGLDGHHGKIMSLTDYFDCRPVRQSKPSFVWEGVTFTPFQTLHINCGFSLKDSYGVLMENKETGKTAMLTGDAVHNPDGLDFFYRKADIIFQDCETGERRSRVHAHIEDLKTLPAEIKSKMFLYHYTQEAEAPDFRGFIKQFDTFEI